MTLSRNRADQPQFKAGVAVLNTLRAAGHEAFFVGGCVRDVCMGEAAETDYDIATSARPAEVAALFKHTVAVGEAFGVMLVIQGEEQFEVATFRRDGPYLDGRHPASVAYSSAREDAERRDFTINGMMWDPVADTIHDWVGGRADIEAKLIRAIGDPARRFEEDKLRVLRAVRFAARFGFAIEQETYAQVVAFADGLNQISAERIREELSRLLVHKSRSEAFRLMKATGILRVILPEIDVMEGVEQPPQYHPEGDVWVHTLLVMDQLPDEPSLELAWAALLHDVGKPPTFKRAKDRIRFDGHQEVSVKMADAMLRRLRFSNRQIDHIKLLVGNHMQFMHVEQMREATLKRFMSLDRFEEHLELNRADCMGGLGNLDSYNFVREKYAVFQEELAHQVEKPAPLLTGHDLIGLGFKPGPRFQEILTAVEDARLERRLPDRESALDWVKENYQPE